MTWIFSATLFHVLCVAFVSYHCLIRRREANSAILWIFLTWSFPVIGFVLFTMFGFYRLPRNCWEKHCADEQLLNERKVREESPDHLVSWQQAHVKAEQTAKQLRNPASIILNQSISSIVNNCPLLGSNRVELLIDGDEAYPRMLEAIVKASQHIHLQSFIIANDEIGREFMATLALKARQGVKVKVLYDNLGCTKARWSRLFAKYRKIPNLRLAAWTQMNLIKREFQVNLRNHRKLLVVDGDQAFIGGINISSHNTTRNNHLPIRDYHFQLHGPVVQELQYTFMRDWHFMTADGPSELLTPEYFPTPKPSGSATIRVINSGPTETEMEAIANVFFAAITAARERIMIITPYFVPFREIIQALRAAAMRGVRVQVVVPSNNNHFYAGWAGRSLYEELLRAGVEIYEREPPFMHAKAMLVDQGMALVGTANFDACSLRLDYETNIAVFDQELIDKLHQAGNEEINASRRIDLQSWLQRPTHRMMLENFCGLLSPIL